MYYEKSNNPQDYRVIVGHASVTVSGRSRDEAIQNARTRLCIEMPRMWDVIESLDPRSFQIQPLNQIPDAD
jgi:hypothetical protein